VLGVRHFFETSSQVILVHLLVKSLPHLPDKIPWHPRDRSDRHSNPYNISGNCKRTFQSPYTTSVEAKTSRTKYLWDDTDYGKTKQSDGEEPVPVPRARQKNLHGLASDCERASPVEANVKFTAQRELNKNRKLKESHVCLLTQCNNNVPKGT
jgi:hypothetical protein